MELWRLLLTLSLWDTILSKSIIEKDKRRVLRQAEQECCPCPVKDPADQVSESTHVLERPISGIACPCNLLDSAADSSFIAPALHALEPIMRAIESKSDAKPILEPEVGLASSVLETLSKVTDEEYQHALTRDAERSASKILEMVHPATDFSTSQSRTINIFFNPEEFNGGIDGNVNESLYQNTKCFNFPLSSAKDIESIVMESRPNLANIKLKLKNTYLNKDNVQNENMIDMDNAPSNFKEHVFNATEESYNRNISPLTNALFGEELLPIKEYGNRNDERFETWSPRIPNLSIPSIFDHLQKTKYNLPFKNLLKSSVNEVQNDCDLVPHKHIPIFGHLDPLNHLRSINNLKSILSIPKSKPFKLKDLVNLRDVELIKPVDNRNILVNPESGLSDSKKISDLLQKNNLIDNDNIEVRNKNELKTSLLDILPSASENKEVNFEQLNNMKENVDHKNLQRIGNSAIKHSDKFRYKMPVEKTKLESNAKDLNNKSVIPAESVYTQLKSDTQNVQDSMNIIHSNSLELNESFFTTMSPCSATDNNLNDLKGYKYEQELPSVKTHILNTLENLKKTNVKIQQNLKSNLKDVLQRVGSTTDKNQSGIHPETKIMLADVNKEKSQKDFIISNSPLQPVFEIYNSSQELNKMKGEIQNSSQIKFDKVNNILNDELSINNQNKEMKPQPSIDSKEDVNIHEINDNKSESIGDTNENDKIDLNTNLNEVINPNVGQITSINLKPTDIGHFKTKDEINDFNTQASESITNQFPQGNSNNDDGIYEQSLKVPKELVNRPYLMEGRSYRAQVAKHLQQINDLLHSNKLLPSTVTNSNNNCPEETLQQDSTQLSSSHLLQPMVTTETYYFQKQVGEDLESMTSNMKENKIFDTPTYTEKTFPTIATNGNKRNWENTINDYFNKKNSNIKSLENELGRTLENFNHGIRKLKDNTKEFPNKLKHVTENSLRDKPDVFDMVRNSFTKPKNILRDPFAKTDLLKSLSRNHNTQDINDKHLFHNNALRDKKRIPYLRNDNANDPVTRTPKNNLDKKPNNNLFNKNYKNDYDPRKSTFLKSFNLDTLEPKKKNKDLFWSSKQANPKVDSNIARDPIYSQIDKFQRLSDKKEPLVLRNHKKLYPFIKTTARPNFLESKKAFDKPTSIRENKWNPKIKSSTNKVSVPILNAKNIDPKLSPSEIVPKQIKTSKNIFQKSKSPLHDIKTQLFTSEELNMPSRYANTEFNGAAEKIISSGHLPEAPRKPLIKLNDQKPILTKMLKAARSRHPQLNPLTQYKKIPEKQTNDLIPLTVQNTKAVSVVEEPLKENVSYKCKMVCFRDDE